MTIARASMTNARVNDRWSTRSGVRVSAPDIAVDGSDRRRRGHQRSRGSPRVRQRTGQAFFGFETILPARKFVLAPEK